MDSSLFSISRTMVPITSLRQEKQDLYGQILIYYYYYLNCRNVPMDSECDNRNSSGSFSMKDLLIDAIIVCTMGLFAMVPVMILLWALDFVQL
jgi:Golgi nucleoside diphosphatase